MNLLLHSSSYLFHVEEFYLLAFSHSEVPELVDCHLTFSVPYKDTVCPSGKQQGCQPHTRLSMVHNGWKHAAKKCLCF